MQRGLFLTLTALLATAACATAPAEAPRPEPEAPSPAAPPPPVEAKQPEPEPQKVLIALKRVHFGLGSAKLNATSRGALDQAAAALKEHADLELEIEGHADERGDDASNLQLGEERAQAVQSYLARAGVDRKRISATSKGEGSPLATGTGKGAWAENRRVEFRIVRGNGEVDVKEGVLVDDRGRPLGGRLQHARHGK
jgi:outer membrane protein OmpA-like peptidoglycan-associated protein